MNIHYCKTCSKYTLKEKCLQCNQVTILPKPPKYTPDDKYMKYRAEIKIEERRQKGLVKL